MTILTSPASTEGEEGAKPSTSIVAVFNAYFELAEARTAAEKLAILERLYREGWNDGLRWTVDRDDQLDDRGESLHVDPRECEGWP